MNIIIPWRTVVRRWSLWLAAAGGILLACFTWFPAQALGLWQSLPPQMTAHVPKIAGMDIGLVLIFLAKLSMFLDQKAIRGRLDAMMARLKKFSDVSGAVVKKAAAGGGVLAAALVLALPLIVRWEGRSSDPYLDMAQVRTVCFGHTGADIAARHYSDAECRILLDRDMLSHARPVLACSPQLAGRDARLAAFTSFNFNTGAYCRSAIPRLVAAGQFRAACAQLDLWVYAGHLRVQGLVNRRAAERRLCERGLA